MSAKQIALGLGIAIFVVLFVGLTIDFFYEAPNYENFCKETPYREPYVEMPKYCDFNYTDYKDLFDSCNEIKGVVMYDYDDEGCRVPVSCSTCNIDYDNAINRYNRNFFFITIIIATIALVSGVFVAEEFLSIGFIFGGIFTAIYGIARYFSNMSKLVRLITVLIILVILILVGKKKLVKEKKSSKKKSKK